MLRTKFRYYFQGVIYPSCHLLYYRWNQILSNRKKIQFFLIYEITLFCAFVGSFLSRNVRLCLHKNLSMFLCDSITIQCLTQLRLLGIERGMVFIHYHVVVTQPFKNALDKSRYRDKLRRRTSREAARMCNMMDLRQRIVERHQL